MEDRKIYPLRPIQRFLIDAHFKKAKSTMMNVGALLKLSPVVDMERLADAVNETLAAHDIFRCRLILNPDTQDISQTFDGEIVRAEIEKMSDEEFELLRKKKLRMPYKIINQPLYHIYLFETPTSKYAYVDFYHAVMDGVSIASLFHREINLRYNGRNISDKLGSYAQFIEDELNTPEIELAEGHKYWRNFLSDFDAVKNLPPVDVNTVSRWTKGQFKTTFKNISEEFFRTTRRKENIFFLAASMITLLKFADTKKIFMKMIYTGREKTNERMIMGLMYDVFPCAWDFSKDMTVAYFLNNLAGKIRTDSSYKKSLDIVYNESLADDCPFFSFRKGISSDHLTIGNTTALVIDMPPNEISAAENSLDINVVLNEHGMYELKLEYDASRFSEGLMKKFFAELENVVLKMQDEKTLISRI